MAGHFGCLKKAPVKKKKTTIAKHEMKEGDSLFFLELWNGIRHRKIKMKKIREGFEQWIKNG